MFTKKLLKGMLNYYIQIQLRFRADLLDNIIMLKNHQVPYLKLK